MGSINVESGAARNFSLHNVHTPGCGILARLMPEFASPSSPLCVTSTLAMTWIGEDMTFYAFMILPWPFPLFGTKKVPDLTDGRQLSHA